jgi:shikimate dehydrogenase
MHQSAIDTLGLPVDFHRFTPDPDDPEALANFCYETDLNGIAGFLTESPYRETVMQYMDHYDPAAKLIGSVDTVVNEAGLLIGYNTEATAAMQALREAKPELEGCKALVAGAGCSGRSVLYALREYGASVHVFDREPEKAERVADAFEVDTIEFRDIPKTGFDLIINATPVGTAPEFNSTLFGAGVLNPDMTVMDLVATPVQTRLIREAGNTGAQTVTGDRFLLYKALTQFKILFTREAPHHVMEKALKTLTS